MNSNNQTYDFEKSLDRIDKILYCDVDYDEADDIPKSEDLTFTNGKYVQCAAFFIDLRGSSELIKTHKKISKSLARIYRAYISEIVAIINSFQTCKEINIIGDCVSAVFSGKSSKPDDSPIVQALQAASMSNAMMSVLNVKYKKKWTDFSEIKAGIGVSLGRALVIKAGFSGSGINELVYMGDVVNKASKMCGLANKEINEPIVVTKEVYENKNVTDFICNPSEGKTFKAFLSQSYDHNMDLIYSGDFYRIYMEDWANQNS